MNKGTFYIRGGAGKNGGNMSRSTGEENNNHMGL